MVKRQKHHNTKQAINKGFPNRPCEPSKITASSPCGVCGERLSAFGGLLALIKFLDLIGFEEIFEEAYCAPKRTPKLGHYRMVIGLVMLLFIGFNRLWHFVYIRLDSLICGFFQLAILPAATTFHGGVLIQNTHQRLSDFGCFSLTLLIIPTSSIQKRLTQLHRSACMQTRPCQPWDTAGLYRSRFKIWPRSRRSQCLEQGRVFTDFKDKAASLNDP